MIFNEYRDEWGLRSIAPAVAYLRRTEGGYHVELARKLNGELVFKPAILPLTRDGLADALMVAELWTGLHLWDDDPRPRFIETLGTRSEAVA